MARRSVTHALTVLAVLATVVLLAPAAVAAPAGGGSAAQRLAGGHNHRPDTPTGLTTSPATSCTSASPTIVGDAQVTLYAPVSDRDGGVLGVAFNLWKTTAPGTVLVSSDPHLLTYGSGTTAVLVVPPATLRAAAGGAVTEFSWRVRVTDFHKTSAWSTTCRFRFDPTRTQAPVVTAPAAGTATVGKPVTIAVHPPAAGTTPSGYLYQLNAEPPADVTAAADGTASITIVPTRFVNTLVVTGYSAGGNLGESTTVSIVAAPPPPAVDGDLTGDGVTDLVTVGAANGLPSGLWLAAGDSTGAIAPTATNIGVYGNGVAGTNSPADFDGAQIITGRFFGESAQDVLVYYPTGDRAGGGVVLRGTGDGSPIRADLSGNSVSVFGGLLADVNNLNPLQLASAGDSSGQGFASPDLIGISGDGNVGYYLNYYAVQGDGMLNYPLPAQLNTPTPTGGTDWNTWTIATAQAASGTAMFLWQASSGSLYLWNDLAYDVNTSALTYTEHALGSGWNTGQALTLHGGDINGDGIGDLWTVGPGATATAWLVTDLSAGVGTIAPRPSATIVPQ